MKMASIVWNRKCDYHLLTTMFFIIVIVSAEPYSDSGKNSASQNHISSSGSGGGGGGGNGTVMFMTKNNTRIQAQRGGLAILPCSVKSSPSATVSWIRRRDFQLLTVGLSTYSSDDRFLVEHARHMGHWSLRIKSVRDEDKGLYECQLSMHPTQSVFVELKVVEAVADIVGAPDLHIDEGSTLRLECKLKRATENPSHVFWYHNNRMVNYDKEAGFSVNSIPLPNYYNPNIISSNFNSNSISSSISSNNTSNSHSNNNNNIQQYNYVQFPTTSVLTIQEIHFKHAGNYTCTPSNARPASITVHVLRSEKPAAMQHANRSSMEDVKSNSNENSVCIYSILTVVLFISSYHTLLHHLFNVINR